MAVKSGLDSIWDNIDHVRQKYPGKIGYLCHSASVDCQLRNGVQLMSHVFGDRLVKLFSPQHGLVSDVQDNMVETSHSTHPYFKLPIYSLYSETRKPTDEMLEGLDTVFIDLQDVGTRIYTYIYTMTLFMEACQDKDIKIVVLDRPNPINGVTLEGNILEKEYASFVGLYPMPVRHGLTIGEVALMAKKFWGIDCQLEIVSMKGWRRQMSFEDTKLPWVLPSPNLPTIETAYTFVGTVLLEGTNISEGRGSTRSLELFGHPKIEPFEHLEKLNQKFEKANLQGFRLRPLSFLPTFQKHAGVGCGGYQIHVNDRALFQPWKTTLVMLQYFYQVLGDDFSWKEPPYEYVYDQNPFDIINGSQQIRQWIESADSYEKLLEVEKNDYDGFIEQRAQVLIY